MSHDSSKTHHVFVGNLSFNTTDEQLHELFRTVGHVAAARVVTDKDSGKSKGYAFVEYTDGATALSAIRNLNNAELMGRPIRVSFTKNSDLKHLAEQIGQDMSEYGADAGGVGSGVGGGGGRSVESAVQQMRLHEMYDALECMKAIACGDADGGAGDGGAKARAILKAYPQLLPAFMEIQSQLGMH